MAPSTIIPETETAPISDAEVDAAAAADVDAEFSRLLAGRDDAHVPVRPTFEQLDDPRAPFSVQEAILAGSFFLLSGATLVLVVLAAFSH